MNAEQYCEILEHSLLGSLVDDRKMPSDIIFQQDNDLKHTSRRAQNWFKDHAIDVLPWAPSSPDVNIIKHAWDALGRQIRAWNPLPRNLDELWDALVEEWVKLDTSGVYTSLCHIELLHYRKLRGGTLNTEHIVF
jgi:hypothetical protein